VILDNTVYWRGDDGSAYRLNGYTAERISTAPIEQAWAKTDPAQCFAMTFVDRGHKIVYWTQPDGETFGYDAATGLWHRRASYLMNRWRANCLFSYKRQWYAGDYTSGSISQLGWRTNTENGKPLIAERTTTVMQDDRNRFRLNAVEVVMDAQGPTQYTAGESTQIPVDTGPNFLFDVPDAWQDLHNIGTEPPSVWDGTAYNLSTTEDPVSGITPEAILSLPAPNYPFYVGAGCVLAGHVDWTTEEADAGEFTVTFNGGDSPLVVVDEYLEGTSGSFDFSYTFDGTEFPDPAVNPNGYTEIQIEILGGVSGEGSTGATAVISPVTEPGPTTAATIKDRILELQISKDGGHTFSPWRQADLGSQGKFNARALFRRLGIMRRGVLKIRYSGDSTRDVIQASVDTSSFP
jgi:hypothetical protein